DIYSILQQADDFALEDDLESQPDSEALEVSGFQFPWLETRPDSSTPAALMGQRVLASLTLTPTTLEVETMSHRRMGDCRQRLEQLLGARIRLVETRSKSADEALREEPQAEPEEPFIPPPELIAEIEEKVLRQWIDESIPALDGLTPREAVKTPEGREKVLELIESFTQLQRAGPERPGLLVPDYGKVKKMLGLE
ncbi:MAG: DUF2384 domain-containing protein, partial [Anaerolineae bacterium]